ncbi:hypothetical protein NHX12_025844 [Muraenolepis orangiensis]|uniref:Uncharacterized protein n=1 Tax=Muraenolepis orangiensis TaxID=630683 RepID=A0A9Q0EHE6_9TELE|nr:hypothetical protein NHX12_025844 [Muraenolepis orangiensis]
MMDRVCCVLLDKLDKSVSLGEPQYHHSTESLSDLRRHRDAALLRVPLRGPVASALSRVSVTFQFLDKTRKKH